MIEIKFDTSAFDELAEKFASIDFSSAVSRALNRVGDMVTTAVGRELASETGMHVHDVRDAMDQERSTSGDLTYTITILGGYASRELSAGRMEIRPCLAVIANGFTALTKGHQQCPATSS